MFCSDFSSKIIIEAKEALDKKIGVCDVTPSVRLSSYRNFDDKFELICNHSDYGLNCGASALYCTRCLDKESFKKRSNEAFKEQVSTILDRGRGAI